MSSKRDPQVAPLERGQKLTTSPQRNVTRALTAAERRVADLAADGLTNREIAQALFVTVKTVEWHLRNTYVKLEIGSRQELRRITAGRSPAAA